MIVDVYTRASINRPDPHIKDVLRIEIPLEEEGTGTISLIVLDADDSTDVIITYADGYREAVWSLAKAPK